MVDNTLYADGLVAPKPTLLAGDDGFAKSAPAPTILAGQAGLIKSTSAPTLSSRLNDPSMVVSAPVPTLVATAEHGEVLSMALSAPVPELVSAGIAGEVLTAELIAPGPSLVAVLYSPAIITASGTAPAPYLSSAGLAGNTLTAALEAAAPIMVAAGYPAYTITAVLTAPAPRPVAVLGTTVTAAYRTWVLNTRKGALSEYGPEFQFNSFAQFNNQTLACGANGVVVLGTQSLDNATAITARVRTGQEGFESSLHKRVPRIYTSGTYAGDMLFRTITEGGTRTYSLPHNGITRLQQRRVPIGKGPKSRFWQFELENVGGADFGVNDVLVLPTALRRRVQ